MMLSNKMMKSVVKKQADEDLKAGMVGDYGDLFKALKKSGQSINCKL